MSSSESNNAPQIAQWQHGDQRETPANQANPQAHQPTEPAPSWQGYAPEPAPAEYATPYAYPTNGAAAEYVQQIDYAQEQGTGPIDYAQQQDAAPAEYVQQQAAPAQYAPPPEAPADYVAPSQYVQAADVPAGAGMVPPRSDAVPPEQATPADAETQGSGWSMTDYSATQGGYAEAPASYQQTAPSATQVSQPAVPPRPSSTPKPEDLLVPDRPSIRDEPAQWGWRGRLNRMTGGALSAQARPAELADRKARMDIQRGFSRPMTVVVIQPKGGAGKTPMTIGIAAALGSSRGGYVIGWDDNETRGTLAVRVVNRDSQRTTVWDLLHELPAFERAGARFGDLGYYVRSQHEAQFDALVSDYHPGNMEQIGEDEFHRIHAVLQRFYRVIVIDTGNNVRSPNWQAAVTAADVVVVPSTYQRDVGFSGSWVLDHLIQTGREELAQHAVTVLTAADPTTDDKVRKELLRHFAARTQNVVEIPYDPHIATGGPIHWNQLADQTRRALIQTGAYVVQALAQRDNPQR